MKAPARRGGRNGADVLEFMRLMWAVDHQLQSTSKRMHSVLGVTGPQRLAVRLIGRHPGLGAGALAAILHLHPSTVTGVLDRLVRGGLVVREPDPADARRVRLRLTARGRRVNVAAGGTVESAVQRALREQPVQKVQAARDVLGALGAALAEACQNTRAPGHGRPGPARRA